MEYTISHERKLELLFEAQKLAHMINLDRSEEIICDADHTTRLCEILDILEDDMTGQLLI